MKNLFLTYLFGLSFFCLDTYACKNCGCSAKKESHSHSENSTTKNIDELKSTVKWKAKKVNGSHEGLISIKEAHLHFEKESLSGGTITMDMQTISCIDLDGDAKKQLESHLLSDDFFGTNFYPTAELEILETEKKIDDNYTIVGVITIKGIKKNIQFDAKINNNNATAMLTIDRSEFNVRYGSGSFFDNLGDNLIYDDFNLEINIVFK